MYTRCLSFILFLFFIGCSIPLRRQLINDNAFENPEILQMRIDLLLKTLKQSQEEKKAISQEDVFKVLNISDEICEWLLPDAMRAIIYPGFELRGGSEEQEEYKRRIQDHKVCLLKYVHLESVGTIGIPHVTITLSGHDQKLALVFDKNVPVNVIIAGRAVVNDTEVIFLWDYLGSFAASFASKGGSEAVSALGGI